MDVLIQSVAWTKMDAMLTKRRLEYIAVKLVPLVRLLVLVADRKNNTYVERERRERERRDRDPNHEENASSHCARKMLGKGKGATS